MIVTVAVAVQPLGAVTVTVYVVVVEGVAVGLLIVELFREEAGNQTYVPPPVAFRVVFPPLQTVALVVLAVALAVFTLTVTVVVPVHPLASVTVSGYVVVTVGEATGLLIVELFNEEDGAQL